MDMKALENLQAPSPVRPGTPSDRTGVISRTGLDVEAQILDGGGMANMGGRGMLRGGTGSATNSIDLDNRDREELAINDGRSGRHPTPLRESST